MLATPARCLAVICEDSPYGWNASNNRRRRIMNLVTIDGRDFHATADQCVVLFLVVEKIVNAGSTEIVVMDGNVDGQPTKNVILVTPATRVQMIVNRDELTEPIPDALGENISTLQQRYFDVDERAQPIGDL